MARMPEAERERMHRGESRFDPRRFGSVVGVVGGVVFVVSYVDFLSLPLRWAASGVAVGLALAALYFLFVRPRRLGPPAQPHRFALLIYLASVALMLALIAVGRLALDASSHADAAPSLIAIVVGLHFLPFALAFRTPFLRLLGLATAAIGIVGVALAILLGQPWGPAGAVVAGLAMLLLLQRYALGLHADPAGG